MMSDAQFTQSALFPDFNAPDLTKTGSLIPLSTGHNGQLSVNEKTIYELHLVQAGFIQAKVEDEEEGIDVIENEGNPEREEFKEVNDSSNNAANNHSSFEKGAVFLQSSSPP
jgi:hypothetical protein